MESLFGGRSQKSSLDMLLGNLLAGREVRAFADRTVSASYVIDVADAALELVERRAAFGLYHCVNTGHTTWLELTRALARLAGTLGALVTPVNMAGRTMRVPRPLNAAMSNAKLCVAGVDMPSWQDAIERYVAERRDPRERPDRAGRMVTDDPGGT